MDCPWCGYPVSTSNIGQWCANCYVMFRPKQSWIHFGRQVQKTEAEIWAHAISKSGGMKIGGDENLDPKTTKRSQDDG